MELNILNNKSNKYVYASKSPLYTITDINGNSIDKVEYIVDTTISFKVNTTKDNAISNFENEYQAELENALTQLKTYKQNLVESLKKTQEQN